MNEQHISFTPDEEMDESLFINCGFRRSCLSPLMSPKRNQLAHAEYDDQTIPVDGMCFSSVSFDWGAGVIEEEAQPTVAHFSLQQSANRLKDTQPVLPSYDACPPVASSSCHWETQQPFTMQRTYPSYSAQPLPIASVAPREFLSVVQSKCSTPVSSYTAQLPRVGISTVTAPTLNNPANESAEYYSDMLQAAADRVVSACVLDVGAVGHYTADVASPAPPKINIAYGPPKFEFFEQPDQEEVQRVESSSLLKEHVLDFNLDAATSDPKIKKNQDQYHHPTRLSVPSDQHFLDPVHNFLRSFCLEVFVCGSASGSGGRGCGRGAKSPKEGQIGLRCAHCKHIPKGERANQAVSYPSKTLHILESVRNYQRTHFEACEHIPMELKVMHRKMMFEKPARKIQRKYVQAYFAEAACEIGMVETPNGLVFGAPPNTSGRPSEKLRAIMSFAENPTALKDRQLQDLLFPKVDERVKNSKFSHIASAKTRQVINNCRREKASFVYPSDFPTISDFRFVLFHQFAPCRPTSTALRRRKIKPKNLDTLSGLCCKHCAKAHPGEEHSGLFFPLDLESLHDSALFNNLACHIVTCRHVPLETKEALEELQDLAGKHGVVTKRGAKKMFLKKLWNRMSIYYRA